MYIRVEAEFINVLMVTSFDFFKNETYRGVTIYHGGRTATVKVGLEPVPGSKMYVDNAKIIDDLWKFVTKNPFATEE